MVAPTTNWVTLSGLPSGSLSLVSTLPLAVVSSAVVALSATGVGASFAGVTVMSRVAVLVAAPSETV